MGSDTLDHEEDVPDKNPPVPDGISDSITTPLRSGMAAPVRTISPVDDDPDDPEDVVVVDTVTDDVDGTDGADARATHEEVVLDVLLGGGDGVLVSATGVAHEDVAPGR